MANADAITASVILGFATMTAVGGLLAGVAVRWRQPAVIGEIIAGILLGPTLLGLFPGNPTEVLFPLDARPFLSVLANVGLVLFMFGVGFELDLRNFRQIARPAVSVSAGSILLPLVLGAGLGVLVYPWHKGDLKHSVGVLPFALFLGVAMSITAFPVLARILTGLKLHGSGLGAFVMACAALADVIAWALLAVVVALVGDGGWTRMAGKLGGMVLFGAALTIGVRPLLRWVLRLPAVRRHDGSAPLLILVVGLLLSSWVTARLGFHPIFGAFLFGAITPRDAVDEVAAETPILIEQTSQLLVPVFFITTGLSTDISALGGRGYLEVLFVLLVACAGKFAGAALAARACGMDARRSAATGVLMNSRGLTELVVLQVGLSLGVLDSRLASAMIVMAVVTTVIASPIFRGLYDRRLQSEDEAGSPLLPGAAAGDRTTHQGVSILRS
ncbi:cation:proton antiporter [Streptomyces sp. CA-111067]|uniref:cation:proton antiporter n=1 Tax=Streptomyces sp. CA-111067 TaxID=3240046 RepID=UPI003D981C71